MEGRRPSQKHGTKRIAVSALVPVFMCAFLVACGAPSWDSGTLEGKAAILDYARIALTNKNCAGAVAVIEPLYASKDVDNEVRLVRASAQGCVAGVDDLLGFVSRLLEDSATLGGAGFWTTMTKLAYNSDPTVLETRITASQNATDALMATLRPGAVVATQNQIFIETFNPGSLLVTDRKSEASLYQVFISMAAIGALQSRYGDPDPTTFGRGRKLGADTPAGEGWNLPANVLGDVDACNYAASVVTMIDSIGVVADSLSGSTKDSLKAISDAFASGLDGACEAGCVGCNVTWAGACTGSTGRPCMTALRNRDHCLLDKITTDQDDKVRCAASGIAAFVSDMLVPGMGWQP